MSEGDSFTGSGAAARGVRGFGGFFHMLRSGCTRGGCLGGLFCGFVADAVAVCFEGLLRGHVLAGGPASHACRRGSGCTRGSGFLFGGLFHMLRSGSTRGFDFLFWGALLLFVLRVVAGACVGRGSGQPTAAAGGAAARGVRGIGGLFHMLRSGSTRGFDFLFWGALLPFVLRVVAGACVGRRSGQPRMPPQERQHEGLGGLGDSFAVGLGAVAG